eukprot:TRINITY_DN45285_c0_g1_i2.p2 TRINITY_DN45285_c0_g1~~TRINITY_DN45285_c0_g1_i2.p2  ORF type:complete len:137 (-),score=20.51 TRINITY_DN45285_c0_g1_i2:56-436(-)
MGGEVPMTDDQRRSIVSNRQADSGAVTSLASQALSVLANRRAARDGRIRLDLVRQLELAVLDRNPLRRMDALAEIRKAGITDVEIAEDFIPHVARRLGEKQKKKKKKRNRKKRKKKNRIKRKKNKK